MTEFYVLQDSHDIEKTTTAFHPVARKSAPGPKCQTCGEFVGSLRWLPPHRVELELMGLAFADISFGGPSDFLVSERFKKLYEESHLRGLEGFESVEITKVKIRRVKTYISPPKYFHVTVPRDTARIDDWASGLIREGGPSTCLDCGSTGAIKYDHIVLMEDTWSGNDAFYARGLPGTVLVSNRFAEFYRSNQITGGRLVRAAEYGYDRDDYSWLRK